MTVYTSSGAIISGCYRYLLWREWRDVEYVAKNWRVISPGVPRIEEPRACVFVMLNPSTADGNADDPTIRRCVSFARRWRYARLVVLNLFAFRATDPRQLLALDHNDDPVGPHNLHHFSRTWADAGIVVCAWGCHGSHLGQDETALGWIGDVPTFCLGLTKNGYPKHPLYVPGDAPLIPFNGTKRKSA